MQDYTKRPLSAASAVESNVDVGLRSYMQRVYNYMAGGLALTGGVAYLISTTPALQQLFFGGPQAYLFMFAPLAFSFFMAFRMHTLKESTAQTLFWSFAGVMGISLSTIFLVYTGASIARTFFITAAMFGGMSLWGYTTKKDLTGFGSFLMMGFWGLFIGFIINMFLGSTQFDLLLSAVGVLIFTGITAYSTQQIKEMYYLVGRDQLGKASIIGAYTLYITFINLMLMLLRFVGDRR